jgi:hypothetical protein
MASLILLNKIILILSQLIIILLLINITNSQLMPNSYNNFTFIHKPKESRCFFEQVHKDYFFKIEINPDIYPVHVWYRFPQNNEVQDSFQENFKKSFTTKVDGEFKFCVISSSKNEQRVSLKFSAGVQANDFSNIIKEVDLKPVNQKVYIFFYF